MGGDPRERALHSPPLGLHLETALVGGFADDLQLAAEDDGGPVDQAVGEALVAQTFRTPGWSRRVQSSGRGPPSRSWTFAATTWTARSRPRNVGDDESLASFDLFARVAAPGRGGHGVCSADGLRVDQPRARLGGSPVGLADSTALDVMDPFDGAVVVPPGEVPVHGGPGREVLRQLSPGATGPHNVEDRVHDSPPRMLLPPTALRSHPCWRQQRLHQRPLFVRQVRRIPAHRSTHMRLNDPFSPGERQISDAVSHPRVTGADNQLSAERHRHHKFRSLPV